MVIIFKTLHFLTLYNVNVNNYISLHKLWDLLNFTFSVKLCNGYFCSTFTWALLNFVFFKRKGHVNVMKKGPLQSFAKNSSQVNSKVHL